ncbi:hypothetical protein BGX24_008552 [Mortierella sp. AD032]|nr:hypothetical protein BGX24_008552 [Mortierella sp. AD032]
MLTFYAKYSRDDYANSIRWSRIGGLLEMVTLFRNSRARVPTQSSIVMSLTIFASLSILFVNIFLGGLVSRADKHINPGSHFASTEQLMSTDPLFFWTAYMGSDNTMEMTLTSIFNDTQRNPSPDLRTRYTPRTYHYDAVCRETAAYFGKDYFSGLVHPPPPMNCKCTFALLKNGTYIWEPTAARVHFISPNVVVVAAPVYPVNASAFWLPQLEISGFERHPCVRTFRPSLDVLLMYFPKDGIINLPRTDTTKCQYSSDESIVLSTTYIDFAVNNPNNFDSVVTSIFDDPTKLPLLQSMSVTIKNGTFFSPINTSTLALVANISFEVDYLICISRSFGPKENMKQGLLCTYMATTMISVKPQPWDPAMAGHLNRTSASPINADLPISRLDLTVYHLPQASASKNTTTSFSTAHLLQATADATEYLASLGHNVFVDAEGRTESEGLFILFDTVQLEDAFEVATVSLVVLLVVVVVCAVAWAISEVFYSAAYNGSLYKVIYLEIKEKKESTSMLMHCVQEPLKFEGQRVIPGQNNLLGVVSLPRAP